VRIASRPKSSFRQPDEHFMVVINHGCEDFEIRQVKSVFEAIATAASAFAATMSFSKASSRLKRPVFSVIKLFSQGWNRHPVITDWYFHDDVICFFRKMTGITGAKARPPARRGKSECCRRRVESPPTRQGSNLLEAVDRS
jgi:hypothetical protein